MALIVMNDHSRLIYNNTTVCTFTEITDKFFVSWLRRIFLLTFLWAISVER